MRGRAPTAAEKRHMAAVAALGCCVCRREGLGLSPAAIHHTDGKTKPGAHLRVLGLCAAHHQTGGYGVALHAGKAEWERRYGTEEELLAWTETVLRAEANIRREFEAAIREAWAQPHRLRADTRAR